MKLTYLSQGEAWTYLAENAERFPYQLVRRLSAVEAGRSALPADLSQVIEARFFGPGAELRFYQAEDALAAALVEDEPGDVTIDRTVRLLPQFGAALTRRQYIAFDEDGQGYVQVTRLVDWKGEGEYGG